MKLYQVILFLLFIISSFQRYPYILVQVLTDLTSSGMSVDFTDDLGVLVVGSYDNFVYIYRNTNTTGCFTLENKHDLSTDV